MKVTIVSLGSRGDVQPYVALGRALIEAGHTAILVTSEEFRGFVTENGLEFRPVSVSMKALVESPKGRAWMSSGRNPIKLVLGGIRLIEELSYELSTELEAGLADAEVIVSNWTTCASYYYARMRGIPWLGLFLQPMWPSGDYPFPVVTRRSFGPTLNRLSHRLLDPLMWQIIRLGTASYARTAWKTRLPWLGMHRDLSRTETPMLFAVSEQVHARPSDWPAHVQLTGYLYLHTQHQWQPPDRLRDYLASGPPPVYVGFGSMSDGAAERTTELVLEAGRQVGVRLLLLTGWGGLDARKLPDDVLAIDAAPHEWLFPRMAAVVHHGGAGTTAAGVWAGVPGVVVPFFADQPFWGEKLHRLGVGGTPIPKQKLTAEKLAASLREALSPERVAAAAALGARVRAEEGGKRAVEAIEGGVASLRARRPWCLP